MNALIAKKKKKETSLLGMYLMESIPLQEEKRRLPSDEERCGKSRTNARIPEESERQDGLHRHFGLDIQECHQEPATDAVRHDDLDTAPSILISTPVGREEDANDAHNDRERSHKVDALQLVAMGALNLGQLQDHDYSDCAHNANG